MISISEFGNFILYTKKGIPEIRMPLKIEVNTFNSQINAGLSYHQRFINKCYLNN